MQCELVQSRELLSLGASDGFLQSWSCSVPSLTDFFGQGEVVAEITPSQLKKNRHESKQISKYLPVNISLEMR